MITLITKVLFVLCILVINNLQSERAGTFNEVGSCSFYSYASFILSQTSHSKEIAYNGRLTSFSCSR